jgi:hypothetical protein
VRAIGVSESNVHAGEFLVLQDFADYIFEFEIGSDGELADAIAVLVGVRVSPENRLSVLCSLSGPSITRLPFTLMVSGCSFKSPNFSQR